MAVILAYVLIFSSFQVTTYDAFEEPYSPFHQGARVEIPEDEIELLPENIMLPANFDPSDVKNTARDANDDRPQSETDYSTNKSTFDGAKAATDLEKELFANAKGVKEREKIKKMIQDRQDREREAEKERNKKLDETSDAGGSKAAAGIVSVEYNLKNRTSKSLPKPLYMCGVGASGRVVVRIKVDISGSVISAAHDPSKDQGNVVSCMIQTAQDYARRSKFNYSGTAPKMQSGTITYVFVSQ